MANTVTGGSVVWNFDVDDARFNAGLQKARTQAQAFGNELKGIDTRKLFQNMEDGFNSVANTIKKVIVSVGLIGGAISVFAIKSASDFEQNRVAFDTMLGSAEAAQKMLKELSDFAIRTPFTLPDVVQGAKQLLAYGITAQDILPDFEALGNIAAGVGRDKLPFLTLAFGQVATKGKLAGQEIRQFTEAGVPLVAELAKTLGKTREEIVKMSEAGEISFDDVRKAIHGMSGEGGRFFNLMERQSKTFGGVMSNIQDQIGRLARSILGISESGDIAEGSLFAKLKDAAEGLLNFLNNNTETIKSWGDFVVRNIGNVVAAFAGLAAAFVAMKVAVVGITLTKSIVGFAQFIKAVKAGTGVVGAFNAVAALNPFVAVAAAIAALVAVLVFLQIKFNIFGKAWQALKPIMEPIIGIVKDFIGSIVELAKKIGELLAPVFEFVGKHAEVFKKILIGVLAVAFFPLIAGIGLMLGAMKLLTIGIKFLTKHWEGFKDIMKVVLAIAFAPLIAVIAPIILLVKNWGKIMEWIGGVFQDVGGFIVGVATAIKDAVVAAWQFMFNIVSTVMNAIWFVVSPILNFIKNLFIIVFGSILLVVLYVLDFLKNLIITTFTFWFNIIKTVLTAIWNVVTTIWNAIFEVISTVIQFIWDRIVNAFNFWKDLIVGVFTAVYNFVKGIWDKIFEVISGIVGKIIDFFRPAATWLFDKGKDIVNGLVNGIKNVAKAVWNAIKAVADQIGDFFKGAANWLFDTGKAIVQGLINGLKSMVGKVGEAAKAVGDAVKNKVKGLFGIDSPSKLFHEYGMNLMQGMSEGIEKNKMMVSDALGGLADNQINARINPDISDFALAGANGNRIENHIGAINLASDVDADIFLQKLTRQDEVTKTGLTM